MPVKEIEAKFMDVDIKEIRKKIKEQSQLIKQSKIQY